MSAAISREEAEKHAGDLDQGCRPALRTGMPLTREVWKGVAWGGGEPDEWTAEHEMEVPECFSGTPRRSPYGDSEGN